VIVERMQALYDSDASNIKAWWLKCPRNQITTLDTHDGLGVVDVADLMTEEQIERTKSNIFAQGAKAHMRYIAPAMVEGKEEDDKPKIQNLDIYQVCALV
jgi:hypothetical protein